MFDDLGPLPSRYALAGDDNFDLVNRLDLRRTSYQHSPIFGPPHCGLYFLSRDLKFDRLDMWPPRGDVRHMMTLDKCVDFLADLARSGEAYSESRIDISVDTYLVGFGVETAARRKELGGAFSAKAPVSVLSERIRKRILREDHGDMPVVRH
jgi:hypothetical protein